MMDDFYKVDLHIHTPASKGCYKGKKEDEEYFRILETAKSKNIRVIAITDHNTIQGYKSIIRLKDELQLKFDTINSVPGNEDSIAIGEIRAKLALFDDLLILPGVEFEVRECIHMLVIFNPNIQMELIEYFLYDGGYTPDSQGLENNELAKPWSIVEFFENLRKIDCICIDAHTDQSKGIYKDLKHNYRIEAYSSPELKGVCYCDESNVFKISEFIKHSITRDSCLPIMQFSDAHKIESIGSKVTWFRLPQIDYNSLKLAFDNPVESISIRQPEIDSILNTLISSDDSIYISKTCCDDLKLIQSSLCALMNTNGGYCILGVDSKLVKKGIDVEVACTLPEFIQNTVFKTINTPPRASYSLNEYPISENKVIYCVRVYKQNRLSHIVGEDVVYKVKDHASVIATVDDINALVYDMAFSRVKQSVQHSIQQIERDIFKLKHSFDFMKTLSTYQNNNIPIRAIFKGGDEIKYESTLNESPKDVLQRFKGIIEENPNYLCGHHNGKYVILSKDYTFRLEDAYTRITPLRFNQKKYPKGSNINANSIIISPWGGVHYVEQDSILIVENDSQCTILHNGENKREVMLFTTMFLKSSFVIWLMMNTMNTTNLWDMKALDYIYLPSITNPSERTIASLSIVIKSAEELVKCELELLKNLSLTPKEDFNSISVPMITDHNAKAEKLFYIADLAIYDMLMLNEMEINGIESYLSHMNVFIPNEENRKIYAENYRDALTNRIAAIRKLNT